MQFISDIHLEYGKSTPFVPITSKNLCLIGDIGHPGTKIYDDFIYQCSINYQNVFMIYGNHEYFSLLKGCNKAIEPFDFRLNCTKSLPKNIYFLNNSCVYLNTITNKVSLNLLIPEKSENYIKIIGSTLWSDNDDKSSNFKHIYMDLNNKLTFEVQSKLFNESKNYILKEINREKNIKCILLTHYGTHRLCTKNSLDNKDTNHILELFKCSNLLGCLNGHTHNNINTYAPGTNIKLISNCLGCKTEDSLRVNYNPNALFNYENNYSELSFYGYYSNSNNNDFDIIDIINNRKNKVVNIGPIDSSVSYIITSRNKDNSIIYVNKSFEELSGYELYEIKGRNCRFMQSPDGIVKKNSERLNVDNNILYNMKNNLNNDQECQFILVNFKKCGTKFFNLITIIPIIYKHEKCFIGLQCDVSTTSNFNLFNINTIDKNILDINRKPDSVIDFEVDQSIIIKVEQSNIIPKKEINKFLNYF